MKQVTSLQVFLGLLTAVHAYPNRLSPTCTKAQTLGAGGAVTIMGAAPAPGTAMTATAGGLPLATGGAYTPGAPITLQTSGNGQWGFYVSAGATFNPPTQLCAGQLAELTTAGVATVVPPAAGGPLTIVAMRAAGFGQVTYQTLNLQGGGGGGGAGGNESPCGVRLTRGLCEKPRVV